MVRAGTSPQRRRTPEHVYPAGRQSRVRGSWTWLGRPLRSAPTVGWGGGLGAGYCSGRRQKPVCYRNRWRQSGSLEGRPHGDAGLGKRLWLRHWLRRGNVWRQRLRYRLHTERVEWAGRRSSIECLYGLDTSICPKGGYRRELYLAHFLPWNLGAM